MSKSIMIILNTNMEQAMKWGGTLIFQEGKQMKDSKMNARTAVLWWGEGCSLAQDGQPNSFKGKWKDNLNQQNSSTNCFRTPVADRHHRREKLVTVTWLPGKKKPNRSESTESNIHSHLYQSRNEGESGGGRFFLSSSHGKHRHNINEYECTGSEVGHRNTVSGKWVIQIGDVFPGNYETLAQQMEKTDAISSSFSQIWGVKPPHDFYLRQMWCKYGNGIWFAGLCSSWNS